MVATLFQAAEKEARWPLEGMVPDGLFLLVDDLKTGEHETEIGNDGNSPGLAGHRLGAEGGQCSTVERSSFKTGFDVRGCQGGG